MHSSLDMCLKMDSSSPRLFGAEISVWLGPQYPSNLISVQIWIVQVICYIDDIQVVRATETVSLKPTHKEKVRKLAAKLQKLTVVMCRQSLKSLLIVILSSYKANLTDILSDYTLLVEIEFHFCMKGYDLLILLVC